MYEPVRRRAWPSLAVTLTLLVFARTTIAEPHSGTIAYTNPKFGFSLIVPGEIFVPGNTRNPEVGALWNGRDGQARLLAVAGQNASGETLPAYRQFVMQQTYAGATFDYTPVRDTWFVLSGRKDGQMFYERITFACEGRYIYGWQLTYPIAERQRYDRIVEAIHRSYRPGRGEDGRCGRS